MKAWSVATMSGLLGVAAGVGTVFWDFSGGRGSFDTLRSGASASDRVATGTDPAGAGRAKIELEGKPDLDFGVMTFGETKSHKFRVRNVGTAPLTLSVRELTCLCTDIKLPPHPIAPGEAADIKLDWRAKGKNLSYRHSATLNTSDPDKKTLILSIHGQVRRIVQAFPAELTFSRILPHQANQAKLLVYGYRDDRLSIVRHEFLHENTRDFFQLDARPLSPEEIAKEDRAKSGVWVTITAKPGLSLGSINQRLRLFFEAHDVPPLNIPIKGSVISDISLSTAYPKFDREHNVLKLGQVPRDKGAKIKFWVWVQGQHQDKVILTPEEIYPNDVLQITVGQPQQLASGAAVKIPLTVEIPPESRFANHLGTKQGKIGRVILRTNHPDAPTLKLYVSFMVGDFG